MTDQPILPDQAPIVEPPPPVIPDPEPLPIPEPKPIIPDPEPIHAKPWPVSSVISQETITMKTIHNEATIIARPGSVEIKTAKGARVLITPACARALAEHLVRYAALAQGLPVDQPLPIQDRLYSNRSGLLQ